MNKLAFAALTVLIAAGATAVARAADAITIPVAGNGAAVPVAAGFDWSGFYAGIYTVAQSVDGEDAEPGIGVLAGVNAQIDFFLVGGEVSIHALTGDSFDTAYGQVTGRGGVLITDDLLAYVSAGYGMALDDAGQGNALAGAGLEYAVNDSVSVAAEYQHGFAFEGDATTDQFSLGAKFHF